MGSKVEDLAAQREREDLITKIEQCMAEFVDADWYPAYRIEYEDGDVIYVSELSDNCSGYESFEIRFTGTGWGCDVDDDGNIKLSDPEDATVTRLTAKEAEDVWQRLGIEHVVDYTAFIDPDNHYDLRYLATLAFYEKVKGYNSHQVMEIMRHYNLD
jgi:hypothetical protein